ncbi:MAG: FHA domain-containing protein [Candidatus Hydrogenedentales bacterium]|jgi:hypothetical protein
MADEHVVITSGTLQGKRIPIEGKLTIGRNPDSGLQLDDLQVSRRHAVIEQTANGTVARDIASPETAPALLDPRPNSVAHHVYNN